MAEHSNAEQEPAKNLKQCQPRLRDDGLAVLGVFFGLAAIIWVVLGQTRRHAFINYDDDMYVYQNLVVLAGLTRRGFLWALTFAEIGHWHPVTWFSHMVDCRIWGLRAGGHHLTNVVLHAGTAMLLFVALKQMTGALWRSALVAALFAIHPQRVESVAWIAERKDVLSGLFFMATILAYLGYVRRRSIPRYALVVILFALGLMSKGMLITLPFVLLLLDYWPLARLKPDAVAAIRRPENRALVWRLVTEKIPLFALSVASCVITSLSPEKIAPALQMSLPARIENAIVSYVIYVEQMLWPAHLTLPYFNPAGGFPLAGVIVSLALLVAVTLASVLFWKTRPYLMVGWFWYLGMMAPVIGLVQISYYTRADRYTYLPHIGLYLLAVWGVTELLRGWRYRREIAAAAALLLIVALTVRAQAQTAYWHDSERLWRHVLNETPDNFVARTNLGLVLDEKGQVDAAITQYERALEIQPAYVEAHNNLGNALCRVGRVRDAIAHYETALDLVPGLPQVHNNLGTAFGQEGRIAEAMSQFRKALEITPGNAGAHANLGYTLQMTGKKDEALREFLTAIELKPNAVEAQQHVADLYLEQGKVPEAIAHYRSVLEITPSDTEVRRKLAEALARQTP